MHSNEGLSSIDSSRRSGISSIWRLRDRISSTAARRMQLQLMFRIRSYELSSSRTRVLRDVTQMSARQPDPSAYAPLHPPLEIDEFSEDDDGLASGGSMLSSEGSLVALSRSPSPPDANGSAAAASVGVRQLLVSHSHAHSSDSLSSPLVERDDGFAAVSKGGSLTRAITLLRSDDAYVYLACLGLLAFWVMNNILWIYCSYYAGEMYAYWLMQSTAVLYLVFLLPMVLWRMYYTRTIDSTMRDSVHWRVYLIMGALDSLYNLLTTLASPRTSAPVQNLLFQLPVPMAMLLSKMVWRHTRYSRGQYIGALVIVAGAIVSILPQLLHPDDSSSSTDSSSDSTATTTPDNNVGSVLVYMLGVLAYAIGSVYKEWALKDAPTIDYWYLSFCENTWCLVLGFVLVPALWIPYMGTDTPANTWPHFKAGAKCMFTGVSDMDPTAQCGNLFWLCCIWILANVLVNVLGLAVCRKGDAVLFNLVNSVQLPVSNLMYASPAIMTAALASQFDSAMWIGLLIVSVGFVIYQFLPLEAGRCFVSRGSAAVVHGDLATTAEEASGKHGRSHSTTRRARSRARTVEGVDDEALVTEDSLQDALEEVNLSPQHAEAVRLTLVHAQPSDTVQPFT